MNLESMVAVRPHRNRSTFLRGLVALAAVSTLLMTGSVAESGGGGGSGKPSTAVKFEPIPNSTIKRVILSQKAAERLGIETGKVGEEVIVRKQLVGGRIIPPLKNQPAMNLGSGGFGSFGRVAAQAQQSMEASGSSSTTGESWVAVTLSKGEWERLWKDKPARILPLASRDKTGKAVVAQPSGIPPIEDMKRTMLKLYYKVPGKDHGLTMYNRVRVELQLEGSDEKQLVVPYSSVYYDGHGKSWVYVNTKPLVYERKSIKIKRIVGDLAILIEGPPVGTQVVTVGAPLLYGAEVIFKR